MEGKVGTPLPLAADRTSESALTAIFATESTFREWYEAALPRVYRYLYNRCGHNGPLAEELTQETFVEAIRSRHRFGEGEPINWLIGIARHRLVDHFRRLERNERGLLRLVATRPPQVTWLGTADGDDDIDVALAMLPAAQRAALVLSYVDDLPVREVARLLGRSESAVESLLSRGRESMRRTFGADGR
jgi:RNA polymerase sigma-70 factor (ECF subfamily)